MIHIYKSTSTSVFIKVHLIQGTECKRKTCSASRYSIFAAQHFPSQTQHTLPFSGKQKKIQEHFCFVMCLC